MTDLATNSQGQNESASTGVVTAQVEGDAPETTTDEQAQDAGTQTEEETDELEYEGKKYRVPKALKPGWMMQADYTRKTQEVAEQRKALDAQRAQHSQTDGEIFEARAAIVALDKQLAQYKGVNWTAEFARDAQNAQAHMMQFQQLQAQRADAFGEYQTKEQQRTQSAAQARAKLIEESRAVLTRDIGFTPELDAKLTAFSTKDLGLTLDELSGLATEPRFVKVIHRAYLGEQAIKELAAQKKLAASKDAEPVRQVGSTAGATPLRTTSPAGDKLSTEEWIKRENDRLRQRK